MKNNWIGYLIGIFVLSSSFSGSARADEGTGVPVSAIELTGLGAYAGRKLSVFYVSGRESVIGTGGQTLRVSVIHCAPTVLSMSGAGEVLIPAVRVERAGLFDALNFVVFVVHRPGQEQVFLKNPDGTRPRDPRISLASPAESISAEVWSYEKMYFVSLTKLNQLRLDQGERETVVVNLSK